MPSQLVSVAVPVPGLKLLTYRVPDGPAPVVGARVLVPVGPRLLTGIVVHEQPRETGEREPLAVKDVADVLDDVPFLPASVVALARWVADYYLCGEGEALSAAMPPAAGLRSEAELVLAEQGPVETGGALEAAIRAALGGGRALTRVQLAGRVARARQDAGEAADPAAIDRAIRALERREVLQRRLRVKGRARAFKTRRLYVVTAAGSDPTTDAMLTTRQRDALAALRAAPEGLSAADVSARGFSSGLLDRLRLQGLIAVTRSRVERDPLGALYPGGPDAATPELTSEQAAALDRLLGLAERGDFRTVLVHGVTGSGKTELYLRLADRVRALGRRTIVLVPEIALTPALAAAFLRRFSGRVAVQHSGLSDGERHDQWHRIRRGEVDVVVGTRSAVFAPVAALGLLVVDEEHDSSYKQEESPRYHARDVAVVRGRQEGALVVLGTATPSMESYHNAETQRYERLTLRRRVLDRPLADVRVVDMRLEYQAGGPDVVISRALGDALQDCAGRGEQAVVLLNRRGYAAAVFCRQCGGTEECPNCSVSLTLHRGSRRLRCHYCSYGAAVPATCRSCAAPYLDYLGFGTERVEEAVRALLPGARIARVDRDTVRRRGALERTLTRFARRQCDVLIGTQMIAKGHDFPAVTLVGVVSADVGLGLADFRAAERTFQLLTQVAGRAGRGTRPGTAIVQTLYPDHYSIDLARRQEFTAFFAHELRYRKAMRYPPVVALVNVIVRGRSRADAVRDARTMMEAMGDGGDGFRLLGPAWAPLVKLRGEHRAQFFVKAARRHVARAALVRALERHPELVRRVTVDVDPLSVL